MKKVAICAKRNKQANNVETSVPVASEQHIEQPASQDLPVSTNQEVGGGEAEPEKPVTAEASATQELFPKNSRKLSYAIAMSILGRLRAGEKGSAIAKEYGVDSSTISDIKVGRLYKKALEDFKAAVAKESSTDDAQPAQA